MVGLALDLVVEVVIRNIISSLLVPYTTCLILKSPDKVLADSCSTLELQSHSFQQ